MHHVERRSSARTRTAIGGLAVIAVIGIAVHLARPDGPVGQTSYVSVTVCGAVLAWIGVSRRAGERRAWALLAIGVTLSAVADVIYAGLSWSKPGPDLSIGDVFWLSSYAALFGGLLRMLRSSTSEERWEFESLLDLGAISTVSMLAVWQYTVGDIVSDSSTSALTRSVWAAYPMLDAALLALVARSVVNRKMRAIAGPWLVFGVTFWLCSDFGTIAAGDDVSFLRWLDLGWMLGAVLLGMATWEHRPAGHARRSAAARNPRAWGHSRLALGLLPLLIPGVVDLWMTRRGVDPNPVPLFVATATLAALAFGRGSVLLQRDEKGRALLLTSQRYFSALAANSSDAVLVLDRDGRILNEDEKISAAFTGGRPIKGHLVSDFYASVPGLQAAASLFDPADVSPGQVSELEVQLTANDGRQFWVHARSVNLLEDRDVGGVVVNFVDVTARHEAEDALGHQMLHDPLTGLANRALFRDRIEHALQRSARTGLDIAVVSVDLDGFRTINDSLGHDVGDSILCEVSARLSESVRSGDTLARLGADEFGVLLEQSPDARIEAPALAERLLASLATACALDGAGLGLTASIGITVSTPDATAAELQRQADLAMNEARKLGRARAVVFETAMALELEQRAALERDLVGALDNDEFSLVYQPVVDLATQRITGFEALIRWQRPGRGFVGPDVFIPLAEKSGGILDIGRWVLRTACAAGARWQALHPAAAPLTMAVNVSGVQLASPTLVDDVARALTESGLQPSSLVVELTETVLVHEPARAAARLDELRSLGIRIAIDDFGTGYSSLSYLRQFPIDILKIDRSFVQTITDPDALPALVTGLLGLARALDLETIAEGIEDETQRRCLTTAHCDLAQGYLFAKPLPVSDIDELLAAERRTSQTPTS